MLAEAVAPARVAGKVAARGLDIPIFRVRASAVSSMATQQHLGPCLATFSTAPLSGSAIAGYTNALAFIATARRASTRVR